MKIGSAAWARKTAARSGKGKYRYAGMYKGSVRDARKGTPARVRAKRARVSMAEAERKRPQTLRKRATREFRQERTREVYKGLAQDINRVQAGKKPVKYRRLATQMPATPKVEKALKVGAKTGEKQKPVSTYMRRSRDIIDFKDTKKALKSQGKNRQDNPKAFQKELKRRLDKRAKRQKQKRIDQKHTINARARAMNDKGKTVAKKSDGPDYSGGALSDAWQFLTKTNIPGTKALGELDTKIHESKNPLVKLAGAVMDQTAGGPLAYPIRKHILGTTDGISPLEAAAMLPVGKGAQVAVKGVQAAKAGAKAAEAGSKAASAAKAGSKAASKAAAKSETRSAAAKKAAQTRRNEAAAKKVRAKTVKPKGGGRARGSIAKVKTNKAKKAAAAERAEIRSRKVETESAASAPATKPKEPKTVVGKTKKKVAESKPVKTVTESKPVKTVKEQRQGKELSPEELANASRRQKYLHWKATSPTLKKYRTARKWGRRGFTGYLAGATIANEAGADVPGGNAVKGTIAAIDSPHEFVQTGQTTLRVVPALFTGAISDFILNPAKTVERGVRDGMAAAGVPGGKDYSSKEIFDPVKLTYDHNMEFLKTMADVYLDGSPEKIRDFTKTDMGLWGAAMFAPHLIPQTRKDYITYVRTPQRKMAAKKRARLREAVKNSTDARVEAPPPAVKDSKTGEEYVFQGLGRKINARRDIRETARLTARADAEKGFAEQAALGPKFGRRPGFLKSLRQSSLTGKKVRDANDGVDAADALVTVLAYGLSRDPKTLMRQIRSIRKSDNPGTKREHLKANENGKIDAHNLDFLENNLQAITSDSKFWEAVDEARKQQRDVTNSEHKAFRVIGDTYGIKPPEQRISEMLDGKGKEKKPDDFRRQRARASKKLQEARRMPAGRQRDIAEKRALEAVKRSRQYEVVRAKAYDSYLKEVRAAAEKNGHEEAVYVASRDVRTRALNPEDLMNYDAGGRTSFKTHKGENKVVADRSFESFLRDSIKTPRTRQVLHKMMREFTERFAVVDRTGKVPRREFTQQELPNVAERLDLNPDEYVVIDSQQYKQAIIEYDNIANAEEAAQVLADRFGGDAVKPLRDSVAQAKRDAAEIYGNEVKVGHKYMIVPRAARDELRAQMDPKTGNAMDVIGTPGRVMSRLLLGTSITWAASQIVADAIPLLATTKNPLDLARAFKAVTKEWNDLTPQEKLAIRSTVGESVGVNGYPLSQGVGGGKFIPAFRRMKNDGDIHRLTTDFWRTSDNGSAQAGRFLVEGVKGINTFEKARSGKYRQIAAVAMANGEVERALAGLGNALKLQREASLVMKDMTPLERTAYLAQHHGRDLERATNELMGNWRAMTSTEQKVAPWLIFYPFLRFSLRWSFYTFPKNHPMRASIVAFLGVQHVNELDHILGGPPGFFQAWATGIIHNSSKNWSAVELQRVAPSSNVFVESLGDTRTDSVLPLRAFNPFYGPLAAGLLTGVDPLTGRQIEGDRSAWAAQAVSNLIGGITPVRFLESRRNKNPRTTRADGTLPIVGRREESSWISQIFAALNPDKNKRSFVFPFMPHKGDRYKELQRASALVDKMFKAPDQGKLQDVAKRYGEKSPQYRAELQKLQDSKKASAELKKLAKSLGIDPEGSRKNQRAYKISQRDIYQVGSKYSEAAKGADSTSRGLGGGGGLSRRGL